MSRLGKYEKYLSGGQEPWSLKMRALPFGPFSGQAMPTTFIMDVEYDPVFVQFDSEGVFWIVPGDKAKWVSLDRELIERLLEMSSRAVEMARKRPTDET